MIDRRYVTVDQTEEYLHCLNLYISTLNNIVLHMDYQLYFFDQCRAKQNYTYDEWYQDCDIAVDESSENIQKYLNLILDVNYQFEFQNLKLIARKFKYWSDLLVVESIDIIDFYDVVREISSLKSDAIREITKELNHYSTLAIRTPDEKNFDLLFVNNL